MKPESSFAAPAKQHGGEPLPRVGDGIMLRRMTSADLPAFQAYRCDTDVGRYQGWTAMSDAEATVFLTEMNRANLFQPGAWGQIGIADARSLNLIGDVGLYVSEDAQHAEIGFTLRPQAQRQGLARAAVREAISLVFENTKVSSVRGVTDARNIPSIRLLERIGMCRVETRGTVFRDEPCVEQVYAISRDEMQASSSIANLKN